MSTEHAANRRSSANDCYVALECPFCGQRAGIAGDYSVQCESCGGNGPPGHDPNHGESLWAMRAIVADKDCELIANRTSLHFVVNRINARAAKAIKSGERTKADRLVRLSSAIEEAFTESFET